MPVIKAYKATIKLTGATKDDSNNPFYKVEKFVYGSTIGEMYDNAVEASMYMAEAARKWNRANQEKGYKLSDGRWFFSFGGPTTFQLTDSEDRGGGSSCSDYASIVQTMGHYRHMEVEHTINDIDDAYKSMNLPPIKISREEKRYTSYTTRRLTEIPNIGLQGTKLDEIIAEAQENGAFKRTLAQKAEYRRLGEFVRKNRVKERKSKESLGQKLDSFFAASNEKADEKRAAKQTTGIMDFVLGRKLE